MPHPLVSFTHFFRDSVIHFGRATLCQVYALGTQVRKQVVPNLEGSSLWETQLLGRKCRGRWDTLSRTWCSQVRPWWREGHLWRELGNVQEPSGQDGGHTWNTARGLGRADCPGMRVQGACSKWPGAGRGCRDRWTTSGRTSGAPARNLGFVVRALGRQKGRAALGGYPGCILHKRAQ